MTRRPSALPNTSRPQSLTRLASSAALVATSLLLPALAEASDGVAEINQTCAVQTGCFAGDAAGLPVTITAAGSYRLTSNLVVPNENTDGIQVSADDVGIDLNHFTISGPVVCSGSPLVCTPNTGTGSGVEGTSSQLFGLSVRNGTIRGMGNIGADVQRQAEVTNLRVRSNRSVGILVAEGSIVSGNLAQSNGNDGIAALGASTVSGNTAISNGDDGIAATGPATFSGNAVRFNGDFGIFAGVGSNVSGNSASQNADDGINAGTGSTVWGNTASQNGGDGIFANNGSTVWGNTARINTGFGLALGDGSGYRENVITNNTLGTVTVAVGSFIVNLGANACNGALVCP